MRVLHISNQAGVGTTLSREERKLGIDSDVVETWPHGHAYDRDFFYEITQKHPLGMLKLTKLAKDYDILHIHGGISRNRFDFMALKKLYGKKMIFHYHGNECRMRNGLLHQDWAGYKIVATPDLLEYVPDATFIPNPVKLMEYVPKAREETIQIIHAPTNRRLKGTDQVLEAIKKVQEDGYKVNLNIFEKQPNAKVLEAIQHNDIVIDQLLLGAPGIFSFEGMSSGKPTICYIKEGIREPYRLPSEAPISAGNAKELQEAVEKLINDENYANMSALKGREFIKNNLDPATITKKYVKMYNELIG